MSMPISSTSMGTCPKDCTASVWNATPCSCAIFASSAMGSIVPISLLAIMTEARMVSSRMAASKSAGRTRPSASTGR